MRQVNFVLIFVICLALVLFALENTEPATIKIIQNVQVQAPLAVELILAMGIGAMMAWVFSVWSQVQQVMQVRQEVQMRELRIQQLEEDLERYKVDVQGQNVLPPAASIASDAESTEIYAQ